MSLLVFLLFLGVTTHDEWIADARELWTVLGLNEFRLLGLCPQGLIAHPGIAFLLMQFARMGLMGVYYWLVRRAQRKLVSSPDQPPRIQLVHHGAPWFRLMLIYLFLLELSLGSLQLTREVLGDLLVLDEVLVMLPTLATLFIAWMVYFPVDVKVRQAGLIGQIDEDQPVPALWNLGQYLKLNSRMELATMGLPLIAIMCWREGVAMLSPMIDALNWSWVNVYRPYVEEGLMLVGTLVIFLLSPLVVLKVWRTESLPQGETRECLAGMLERYRIKVRDLLYWHTYGGISNAAVVGTLPMVRFILLTDQLLDRMPLERLKAIMAHEIAHIRYRHLYWYLISMICIALLLSTVWLSLGMLLFWLKDAPATQMYFEGWSDYVLDRRLWELMAPVYLVLGWWLMFGWISRQFERQADTFAVEHFAGERREREAKLLASKGITPDRVALLAKLESVDVQPMLDVFQSLGRQTIQQADTDGEKSKGIGTWLRNWWLNVIISWRHGSLKTRQDYLRGLVGQEISKLKIHRTVKRIKWLTIGLLGLFLLYSVSEVILLSPPLAPVSSEVKEGLNQDVESD